MLDFQVSFCITQRAERTNQVGRHEESWWLCPKTDCYPRAVL